MLRASHRRHIALLVVVALYLGSAIALFSRTELRGTWDTLDFQAMAQRPLGSSAFWLGPRAVGYPLLMKLLGPDSPSIGRLQLVLYLAAWLLAAWGIARRCATGWVRVTAFAVLVAGSLSPGLFGWTNVCLTESLAMSLLLLPLGLVLVVVTEPARPRRTRILAAAVACASLLAWIAMRDLNAAWLVVAMAAATALAFAHRATPLLWRRAALAGLGVALLLAALVSLAIDRGERWRYPLVNVIGRRVLPVPARAAEWQRAGMPDNADVRACRATWAINCKKQLGGFEPWLTRDARRTYVRALLADPRWLFGEPLSEWRQLLCGNYSELGNGTLESYSAATPALWQMVIARVFVKYWRWLESELVIALVLVAVAWRRAGLRLDAATAPLVVLAATVFPAMMLAWHGDAMEMQRHALVAIVVLRVALWGALAVSVDRLVSATGASPT